MQSFSYGGKTINFSAWTGIVSGSTKSSETRVWGSGGGGYVGPRGGYVSAPTIQSTIIRKHEFWLTDKDGKEWPFKIGGPDIPLRDGQKVTVIAGFPKGKDTGWNLLLHNYNANHYWFILSSDELVDYYRLASKWGWQAFVAILIIFPVVSFGLYFLSALQSNTHPTMLTYCSIPLGMLCGFLFGFVTRAQVKGERDKAASLLSSHIKSLAKDITTNA